ncbi:MAG: SDR family oxidoreductase [Paraglaciecola chathamensis]
MKIAVTAASGQLGSSIVNALVKQIGTTNVVALARTPEKAQGLGVEIRPGDYNSLTTLERSLIGVDTVLLVSGMDAPDKRIEQHRNVINAAKNSGVKKIVYTSVQGAEHDTGFSPVIQSNRQTEEDIKSSGLDWVIGRNGIYIEPDVEYIESYKKAGNVSNCAGQGRCAYTNREELAYAYAKMLLEDKHQGHTYNLHGELLTQAQLVDHLNHAFGLSLRFIALTYEQYKADRVAELGDFIGTVIAGIYQGIAQGALENESHYAQAAGRPHQTWQDYFARLN